MILGQGKFPLEGLASQHQTHDSMVILLAAWISVY